VLAAALALSCSLVWGVSDFVGGVLVRRRPVATIAALGHMAGVGGLAIAAVITGIDRRAFLLGVTAGCFGAVSLYTYYKAMSLGTMSIVSPLLSLGSVLAFALAVVGGERPAPLSLLGALLAFGGMVLASFEEHASGGFRRSALGWALAALLALGFYLYLLGRAASEGGSVSAVFGSRSTSALLLLGLALWLRSDFAIGRSALFVVSLLGLATSAALLLFGFAAQLGLISIASILASLYPIVTVLLAHRFLGERLGGVQLAGVSLALLGVVLVTAG
jgi:drug/metabolite transporter (DMT)-like permease